MTPLSYLIDTDWIIDHLHGVALVSQRLRELQDKGLAMSVISVAELWEGAYYSSDPINSQAGLEEFLVGIPILGLDEDTCKRFGHLRGSLRRQGRIVGDFDLLIAATALRHTLTLLTNNRRHFENIPDLQIQSLSP